MDNRDLARLPGIFEHPRISDELVHPGKAKMNDALIDRLLASPTLDPYGWIVEIPVDRGTFFNQQVSIRFETRLLPANEQPPAVSEEERKLADLLLSNLPDLLEEVTRRFEAYNQGNKNAAKLRETIRNPHIWISREVTEDEGPDRWSFVIGFQESADYAIDVAFEGLKCIDVAGGD
ncbi:hypothetical protein NA78x_002809 [Anatilimnocola sp. NA78]|uniref:hypothetical protein n=1 Tax=Anatilimnocola sp. NA78 TaxID=3415683 RepID=UPI003CE51EA6